MGKFQPTCKWANSTHHQNVHEAASAQAAKHQEMEPISRDFGLARSHSATSSLPAASQRPPASTISQPLQAPLPPPRRRACSTARPESCHEGLSWVLLTRHQCQRVAPCAFLPWFILWESMPSVASVLLHATCYIRQIRYSVWGRASCSQGRTPNRPPRCDFARLRRLHADACHPITLTDAMGGMS